MAPQPHIEVRDLTLAYGDFVIQKDLNFQVDHGDIFIIMGGSGCGKSTVLKCLIGLKPPATGTVDYDSGQFWPADPSHREEMMRGFGVLYQSGALWSSMTLAENVGLPLGEYTDLSPSDIRDLSSMKLALVGLAGFEDYYPSEISGGMQKRAGIARAMALDPGILFFDEPSAGLDPISSKRLDDLILELRDSLETTIVVVTHELDSIFAIGNNSIFLDPVTRTMIASGDPRELRDHSPNADVREFLNRGTPGPSDTSATQGGTDTSPPQGGTNEVDMPQAQGTPTHETPT
ncbi:MAG: polyamine ABC transporter ATP-binding protein [Rhodobacteraceae bacterium]|nr:polyamine ABC transporter ATP-binding protein [Paracoccaceae bacterium]